MNGKLKYKLGNTILYQNSFPSVLINGISIPVIGLIRPLAISESAASPSYTLYVTNCSVGLRSSSLISYVVWKSTVPLSLFLHAWMRSPKSSSLLSYSLHCNRRDIAPATNGLDIDVPFNTLYFPPGYVLIISTPGALNS